MPEALPFALADGSTALVDLTNTTDGYVITRQTDGTFACQAAAGGASSPLTLTASAADEVPLTLEANAGQTANIFELYQTDGNIGVEVLPESSAVRSPELVISRGGSTTDRIRIYQSNSNSIIDMYRDWIIGSSENTGINLYGNNPDYIRIRYGSTTLMQVNADGTIEMPLLPTSDPVNAGELWNDAGTMKVSAG